jgi:cyclopropane fatty-acyl-phospholipid synthase-like methyltransferase
VFFQLFTPQGLKFTATAVQRLHPGKVRMPAQQITKIYLTGRNSRVFRQLSSPNYSDTLCFINKYIFDNFHLPARDNAI